jgi:hypothetical protein
MMKYAALAALVSSVVSLNAEKSQALPFMNRPALVSSYVVALDTFLRG